MTVPVPTPLVARTPPLGEPSARHEINLTVNGRPVTAHVESRLLLSDFLRDRPAPEVRSPGRGTAWRGRGASGDSRRPGSPRIVRNSYAGVGPRTPLAIPSV